MRPPASHVACPEKRLLVCCARTRMPPAVAEEIRALAAGPLDWDFVFAAAAENSITPLLILQLRATAADVLPAGVLERLRDAARAHVASSLFWTAELIKISEAFRAGGIQVIPYKGPVLAAQAYGDMTLREFGDLDIVLRQREMAKANELMGSLGYRARFPWILSPGAAASLVPGEYNYRDESGRLLVELHTEVTLRHFPVRLDLDDLAGRLAPVSLSGREIRTFGPEDGLLLLCVHGAKDFWERMSWVADIAELVQAQPLDWDAVFRRAESLRLGRMLRLGLTLARGLLDAPLPVEIAARVSGDEVAASMASEIEHRLLGRKVVPLGAGEVLRFRRHMVEGTIAGWRYFLRLATIPAEEDWLMVRLPRPLAPLYVALRPLRLVRKYGRARGRLPQAPV
jgi:hypothetical protein